LERDGDQAGADNSEISGHKEWTVLGEDADAVSFTMTSSQEGAGDLTHLPPQFTVCADSSLGQQAGGCIIAAGQNGFCYVH
jgi:hypothetical protein